MILDNTNFDVIKKLYEMFYYADLSTFNFSFVVNNTPYTYNAANKRITSDNINIIYTDEVDVAKFNNINIYAPKDYSELLSFVMHNAIPTVTEIDFEVNKAFIYNGQRVSLTDGNLIINYKLVATHSKNNNIIETHMVNMSNDKLQIYNAYIKYILIK